jgi:hypothetical protein
MKRLVFFIALLQSSVFTVPGFSMPGATLSELQNFEPAFIDETSMLKYEARFCRQIKDHLLTKEPFNRNAGWKKWKKFRPDEFQVRIGGAGGTRLVDIPFAKHIYMNRDNSLAAFTVAFGSSPNTSVGVVDMKKNKLVYSAGLVQKPPKAKGPPQIAMENVWFFPDLDENGKYLVCDGFKGTGERESAIMSLADGKTEKLPVCGTPHISGGNVYYISQAKKNTALMMRALQGGKEIPVAKLEGLPRGFEMLDKNGYVITENKIFSFDAAAGRDYKEICDYSGMQKGHKIWSIEKTYSGFSGKKGFIFLAVKIFDSDMYSWKLYGLQVEQGE